MEYLERSCGKIRALSMKLVRIPTSHITWTRSSPEQEGPGSKGSKKTREKEMSCVISSFNVSNTTARGKQKHPVVIARSGPTRCILLPCL